MSQGIAPKPICPYLGLADDRDSRFSIPEGGHRCYATGRPSSITLEHQAAFCFTKEHPTCPRYVEPAPEDLSTRAPLSAAPKETFERSTRFPLWAIVLAGLVGIVVVLAVFHFFLSSALRPGAVTSETSQATASPTPSPSSTPSPASLEVTLTPTPVPVTLAATAVTATTPPAGDEVISLSPAASDIGWVSSGDERGNNFGDSFLYAGVFDDQVFQSAFQFDLGSIPRGAPIRQASLQLTGLSGDRMGAGGAWTVRLLAPEIDENWRRHTYQEIFNAPALQALSPILGDEDLAEGRTNTFELSPAQIALLEERIIKDEVPKVSFRIEGPLTDSDNLFAWDTGYGQQSQGNRVTLSLVVGPPPATPPPYKFIVVTSTPTPENVLTAAAIVAQMTADATRIGTATPVPPNLATATPFPEYLIIIPSATPENEATAQMLAARATAEALTTGTPTPIPTYAVTATPTPTPSPTPIPVYVVITATPSPGSVFAAATLSAAATAQVQRLGPPTPLPANWVTPIVVTSTPTPANQATVELLVALATAQAFTTGTPTSTPINMFTATPTPVFTLLDGELPPGTPTVVSELVPSTIPAELIGKIAFKSDRSGEELIYVINPDGSGLALLPEAWPYSLAREADACSVDGRFRVYVKDAIIDTGDEDAQGNTIPVQLRIPALFAYDALYKAEEQITYFGDGIAYDPAWSPTAEQIAFVSDDSGNDEIWLANRDGSEARQLTRNEWEWDKHPSWSPDGTQIVFWSNRTGNQQIWVMDADGTNLYSLSRTGFNDYDPVWIKYPEVPGQCLFKIAQATAICNDGTYSFSPERSGTCASHGGVRRWLQ